jgi:hypothetical protein
MKTWMHVLFAVPVLISMLLIPDGMALAQVQVTSADPSSTQQGTVSLDVTINGSGFDNGSTVKFLVTGTTDPGGIVVKKVAYRNSKRLTVTIDVSETAAASKFDIEVTTSTGRNGKGTTLFTVLTKVASDACAAPGIDFPAFIFWRDGGNQTQDIYVADSTGACNRRIVSGVRQGGAAQQRFSYPVGELGSNLGRVVFRDYDGTKHGIYGVDFTVSGTTVSVGSKYLVAPAAIGDGLDLSPDGTTVYFSTFRSLSGSTTFEASLYSLAIPSELGQTGNFLYSETPAVFYDISVDASHRALYVDKNDGVASGRQLLRFDLPIVGPPQVVASTTRRDNLWPAANDATDASRFAILNPLADTGVYCWQVTPGQWNGTNASFAPVQQYSRGHMTWYGGNLLVNGYGQPNRRGECGDLGVITEVTPTGASRQLIRGRDPDAR